MTVDDVGMPVVGWAGTSDDPTVARARLASDPGERLRWLEEMLELMAASGVLAEVRRRRQVDLDQWWTTTGADDPCRGDGGPPSPPRH